MGSEHAGPWVLDQHGNYVRWWHSGKVQAAWVRKGGGSYAVYDQGRVLLSGGDSHDTPPVDQCKTLCDDALHALHRFTTTSAETWCSSKAAMRSAASSETSDDHRRRRQSRHDRHDRYNRTAPGVKRIACCKPNRAPHARSRRAI